MPVTASPMTASAIDRAIAAINEIQDIVLARQNTAPSPMQIQNLTEIDPDNDDLTVRVLLSEALCRSAPEPWPNDDRLTFAGYAARLSPAARIRWLTAARNLLYEDKDSINAIAIGAL